MVVPVVVVDTGPCDIPDDELGAAVLVSAHHAKPSVVAGEGHGLQVTGVGGQNGDALGGHASLGILAQPPQPYHGQLALLRTRQQVAWRDRVTQ